MALARFTVEDFIGEFPVAALPAPTGNRNKLAYVPDMMGGCMVYSDGSAWKMLNNKRVESYSSSTDASGNYSVTYSTPYSAVPNVQPQCQPPADALTRVRLTASTVSGFTVKTEKNAQAFLSLLGIDILSAGLANVPSTPVRVLVVES